MNIQAAAVEVLIDKAHFEPKVALAVAEAIDMSLGDAKLVTVPILDARLAALEARLVRWVFLVMLGNVAITAGITAVMNALHGGV